MSLIAADVNSVKGVKIDDFERQMNQIIASVTEAWTDFRFQSITAKVGDIREDSATFTVVVTAKRKKKAG